MVVLLIEQQARRTAPAESYARKMRLAERSAEAIAVFTSSRPVQ
jgi:hypothetical protein